MAYDKGLHLYSSSGGSRSHRGKPYALMLLLALGAAMLGVMVLHKLRERRIYNLIVKEKDRQLLALQLLLQKERDRTNEMTRENEEMKGKIYALRNQKMELDRRAVEMQSTMDLLKEEQKVMESAFEEMQNELRIIMQEKGSNSEQGGSEVIALKENLKQKEAEIKDLKRRIGIQVNPHQVRINHPTIFPEIVTATENKEKDEHSRESEKSEGDDKRITNEDTSKSKLTKFKDSEATVGVEDEIGNDDRMIERDEHTQRQGTSKLDGTDGGEKVTDGELGWKNEDPQEGGGGGVTGKDIGAEVVDGSENKAVREEQPGQLQNNKHGGGHEDSTVKQFVDNLGAAAVRKRKHGHERRTKGKRWRAIVTNRLMEKNEISESHGVVNMSSRRVYRDEKGELKDKMMEKVSDDENVVSEDVGMVRMDNNNPSKDRAQANLLKPENHEDKENSRNMIVNNTNNHVTYNGINIHTEKQRLDEIKHSGDQDSFVQQNWSRRHVNKADKNTGQAKSNMFREELEESEAKDEQKQEKDVINGGGDDEEDNDDDFFKESQSDFEDEKEEYKEEIDESVFQSGL